MRCRAGGWESRIETSRPDGELRLALACTLPPPLTAVDLVGDEPAPVLAARVMTGTPYQEALPPLEFHLATTRGTNALLTGTQASTVLFITEGFGDLLEIGTQQRADLFALDIRKPAPLHGRTVEVSERLNADGSVLRKVDRSKLVRDARRLRSEGWAVAAVALLHADLNPAHENEVRAVLREAGFEVISMSSGVSPMVKLLPRAETTVVDASLTPIIGGYLRGIETAAAGSTVRMLTSAGGLVRSTEFRPKDSLLSGPAGGVVGAAAAAERAGLSEVLTFDMGGTSTDVARWAGRLEYRFGHTVAAATVLAPSVDVHTVAAGGGSICTFDGSALRVGPESAGAEPGPACYGHNGPLTITDVNLLCGRVDEERFSIPVDRSAASHALDALLASLARTSGSAPDPDRVLDGLLDIACERIAGAVQVVSSRRGHSPTMATLLAFGGAGGQVACLVAEKLGIQSILVPVDAGLLSAVGVAAARVERVAERQWIQQLIGNEPQLRKVAAELAASAEAGVRTELHGGLGNVTFICIVAARYIGTETPLELSFDSLDGLAGVGEEFQAAHQRVYGFARAPAEVEVVWVRVIASAATGPGQLPPPERSGTAERTVRLRSGGRWCIAPLVNRSGCENPVVGPAVISEDHGATVVDAGWTATVTSAGDLLLHREIAATTTGNSRLVQSDVVETELYTSRFETLASAMGESLQRTSVSVNVKERLDYSCAVLDEAGQLVACAPHVPVHLGSLGMCIRSCRKVIEIGPGDVVITNHPAFGGSHLPDVTVVAAAFDAAGRRLGFAAARAHHAEIGSIRPGSMPPDATTLEQEGVVIAPMHVVRAGRSCIDALRQTLGAGRYPSRLVEQNLADVSAAIAAVRAGISQLGDMAARFGAERVRWAMEAIQARSAAASVRAINRLRERGVTDVRCEDALDDGTPLRIALRLRNDMDEISFDFSGTLGAGRLGTHPGNLNATPAIVNSCVVYIVRLLAGVVEPGVYLPLNEGLMRPVRVLIPQGMLDPPFDPLADPATHPAVVGGNVETSQRLVNMLVRGLGLAAESQGTMNNLIFGNDRTSYYETICGGAGAGPGFAGASAVHTHMTNTRITDPEILERRYPVRLERFCVRRGTGGRGGSQGWSGGDGIERVIRFLAPMSLSVLTQRRVTGPPGVGKDASSGTPGGQMVIRATGETVCLSPIDGVHVAAGDTLVMRTPGGGGWSAKA